MKLFPAKRHERAPLRKLWRQTGNSSLLPAKCWPLLHVISACSRRWPDVVARISPRFSKFAFVLFCFITNHLITGPLGNSEFCFPRISMFPSTSSRETLRFSRNKIHCSPRDQSLSVYCLHTYFTHWSSLTLEEFLKPLECKLSDRPNLAEPLSPMDSLQNAIFSLNNTAHGFQINTHQHSRNTISLLFVDLICAALNCILKAISMARKLLHSQRRIKRGFSIRFLKPSVSSKWWLFPRRP